MRCKSCDYRLWNLSGRQCPECGLPFAPSDFEFVPNTVAFCCPHCDQSYYGTGFNGLLEPQEFDCVNCRAHVHMDEMVLRPAPGTGEDLTMVDRNPWLDRDRRGFFKGWFATIGRGMIKPIELLKTTPSSASVGSAWIFAILTNSLYALISFMVCPLFFIPMMLFGGGGAGGLGVMELSVIGSFFLGGLVVTLLMLAIWGLVTHGLLRMTGPTEHSLGRTCEALCYTSGANVFYAVPCLTAHLAWIGWIWWMVVGIFAVQERQKVSGGRAAFAVLTFPILTAVVGVGLFVAIMFMSISAAGTGFATAGGPAGINRATMISYTTALQQYAAMHNGQTPANALALTETQMVSPYDFVSWNTFTDMGDVVINGQSLDDMDMMSRATLTTFVQGLNDAMPADVIAHRVGDYVFTYHGIDLSAADPQLWLVVMYPDPDSNGTLTGAETVDVGLADGSVTSFSVATMPVELPQQNALRSQYNLPPLPPLGTILNNSPATASVAEFVE